MDKESAKKLITNTFQNSFDKKNFIYFIKNLFNQYDLTVKVRLELGSNEAIKQAILGGLGISVLSKHTLTSACHEDLTILNVEKFPISRYWYISHLAGKQLSVVAKTFLDFLMDRTLLMKV